MHVDGLPVNGIRLGSDGPKRTVHLTQRIGSDIQVELTQWKKDEHDDADPVAGNPSDSVVEPQIIRADIGEDGYALILLDLPDTRSMLSLRAPVSLDSLKMFVPRLRHLR